MLSFFKQDQSEMKVELPDFFLPGPIIYSSVTDSIILSNSSLEIEAYRYSTLNAKAGQDKSKLLPDWICNIGEQAFHIVYH
jgi:hypothetical protein